MDFTCLYACLTMSGHAPNEMTLGGVLPNLEQGISDFLDGVRCNLVALDGPKRDCDCFSASFLHHIFSILTTAHCHVV